MRIRDVVETATCWCREEPDKHDIGNSILSRIDSVLEGLGGISVVLDDPLGNSAIISDKASYRPLSSEEVAGLETGMIVFDMESSSLKVDDSKAV
jgi:zinc finger protein